MIFSNLTNLQQRLLMSAVGTFSLVLVMCLSYTPIFQYLFAIFAAVIIGMAVWEYYNIAKAKGFQPLFKIGIIGTVVYVFAVFLRAQTPEWTEYASVGRVLPDIALGATLIASFIYYFIKGSDPSDNLAITMFGIMYLTVTLSCLIDINYFSIPGILTDGRWAVAYLLLVTKLTDTAAFFVGKKFGKTKLSPYISPKKTWEGAFGGVCGALGISILLYLFFHIFFTEVPFDLTFWQTIWLAIFISITAQFGDLAESLLKRDVGIKDSSGLPGLGGVLDVVDSLVFTSPLMYIFLKMHS